LLITKISKLWTRKFLTLGPGVVKWQRLWQSTTGGKPLLTGITLTGTDVSILVSIINYLTNIGITYLETVVIQQ
jgi:hypothetical protein